MTWRPPTLQDPSSSDIDSMVASLYRLLASSANVLGACTPPSALGAGWIQSTTEVAMLSAVSGAGTTQPVTSCDSEWGAAVAAQVRGAGAFSRLKRESVKWQACGRQGAGRQQAAWQSRCDQAVLTLCVWQWQQWSGPILYRNAVTGTM